MNFILLVFVIETNYRQEKPRAEAALGDIFSTFFFYTNHLYFLCPACFFPNFFFAQHPYPGVL